MDTDSHGGPGETWHQDLAGEMRQGTGGPTPPGQWKDRPVPTLTGLAGPGDGETHRRPQGKSAVNQAGNGWEAEEQC